MVTFFEMVNPHAEAHRGQRAGWFRAAVLGANDGLVATASLMVGVAASGAPLDRRRRGARGRINGRGRRRVRLGRLPGRRRTRRPRQRGARTRRRPEAELAELAGIYRQRGLPENWSSRSPRLCTTRTHLRDELGHSDITAARPLQAGSRLGGQLLRRRAPAAARVVSPDRAPACG